MFDLTERGCRRDLRKTLLGLLDDDKLRDLFDVSELEMKAGQLSGAPDTDCGSSVRELVQWLDDQKARNHIFVKREGLNTLDEWAIDGNGHLSHKEGRFFRITGMRISSPCREVLTWSQPILDNEGEGIIGLLIRKVRNSTFFLMQAKADVGNRSIIQIGPTVQFNPSNYLDSEKLKKPFLFDEFHGAGSFISVFENRQSEEGGRFYREEHLHRILMLPEGMALEIPAGYRWFSYSQIRFFLHMGDFVNSCARSILACLL